MYGVSADFLLGNTIEGSDPNKPTLNRIQRGLNKMDNAIKMLYIIKDLTKVKGRSLPDATRTSS